MNKNLRLLILAILLLLGLSDFIKGQDVPQWGTPFTGVPDPRDAAIYQVNMRVFSSSRDFQGVISRLDNIHALGINVVYLLPIYPVGVLNSINSPYCISNLNAVGSEFGSLTDLRNLVDTAHKLGMAVILDFVPNQTSWDNAWITKYPSFYVSVNGQIQQFSSYTDVAALNFSNQTMCDTLIQCMRNWVFRANVDGFRCDDADAPPIAFWQKAITSLRGISTHKLLLLAEGDDSNLYSAGFDFIYGWNYYYNSLTQIYLEAFNYVTLIDQSNTAEYVNASTTSEVARFLTNHDIYSSDGSPFTIFNGQDGTMAAFVVSSLMAGIPFVYNGLEVGNTGPLVFPFTSDLINWNTNPAVTPLVQQILQFRDSSFAIRRGTLVSYDNQNVCAFSKIADKQLVFVISNLRNLTEKFILPTGIGGTKMVNAFTKDSIALPDTITLQPYQYYVLTNGNVSATPVPTAIQTDNVSMYPNPASGGYVMVQKSTESDIASVALYNLQGKEVLTSKLSENLTTLDVSPLQPGLYLVKIYSANGVIVKKLIIR